MKKVIIILSVLFMIPITVFADENSQQTEPKYEVKLLETDQNGNEVKKGDVQLENDVWIHQYYITKGTENKIYYISVSNKNNQSEQIIKEYGTGAFSNDWEVSDQGYPYFLLKYTHNSAGNYKYNLLHASIKDTNGAVIENHTIKVIYVNSQNQEQQNVSNNITSNDLNSSNNHTQTKDEIDLKINYLLDFQSYIIYSSYITFKMLIKDMKIFISCLLLYPYNISFYHVLQQ